ncbi:hypothetical protein ASD78_18260 [Lysobacter sp. Root667]|uniref:J domain-containing protein n=1 Tax=Lysobacter sp. Root667 TaxID=1736581 RepID=UPI0006F558AE|nr:DnaJ domain-containing protein [Lysobacter sp. Root667]KRA70767.1 hypothetical protein ASD78_18260 [Lysobacter sp. Root667]
MNPFAELGLEQDADEREVKRAYAAALRQARPDQDPERFQRVNEAYRACLDWLAWRRHYDAQDDDSDENHEADTSEAADPAPSPAAIAADADVDEHDPYAEQDERSAFPDPKQFVAELFEVSSLGSAQDIHDWLQSHPAFYAIGAREMYAPSVIAQLQDEPNLPPRHLAALLHFFGLDEVGETRAWLEPKIEALQRRALVTPEDSAAIRLLFGRRDGEPHRREGLPPGMIWVLVMTAIAVARCMHTT